MFSGIYQKQKFWVFFSDTENARFVQRSKTLIRSGPSVEAQLRTVHWKTHNLSSVHEAGIKKHYSQAGYV